MSEPVVVPQQGDISLPTESEVQVQALQNGRKTFGIVNVAPVEYEKCIMISLMFFVISYAYALLRELKDTFIITKQLPASISVLKLYWVPPISIVASTIVQKAFMKYSVGTVLLAFVTGYTFYFLLFGFAIMPLSSSLEPSIHVLGDFFTDEKMKFRGLQAAGAFLLTLTCWTSTLHFIAAEIWGSMILSLLFLTYANEICPFKQYLRFIPIIYIFSNLALVFSFFTVKLYSYITGLFGYRGRQWVLNIFVGGLLSACCGIILVVGYYIQNKVMATPLFIVETQKKKKKKVKVSFTDGFKMMFKSKLVLSLCIMTLCYNLGTNMVESCYKSCVNVYSRQAGDSANDIMEFLALQQILVGSIVIVLLVTPFSRLIDTMGWRFMGLIPPALSCGAFLATFFMAMKNTGAEGTNLGFINSMFADSNWDNVKLKRLYVEMLIGLVSACIFKITKYAAFDIAKEILSARIAGDLRPRFKAIYDGVCGKFGKAMGALLLQVCNLIGNTSDIRGASFLYILASSFIVLLWCLVVIYLARKYDESIRTGENVDIDLFEGHKGAFDDLQDVAPTVQAAA